MYLHKNLMKFSNRW